ncbi:hypothetical protein HDZ31DRAFT_28288 [Schizophyllum fasciatum]
MSTREALTALLCDRCGYQHVVSDNAPSFLQEKLRNHWIPSADEAETIRLDAIETRKSISAIDKELSSLMHKVENLQRLRANLGRTLSAREALIAPLRRLPVEVLQPILTFACDYDGSDCLERWPTALAISSVSKFYRDVALAIPEVWARIPVERFQNLACEWPAASRAAIIQRLRLYLSRIGNASLPNAVLFPATSTNHSPAATIIEIAREYAGAWEHLKITGYGFFAALGERTLDRLERLHTDVRFLNPHEEGDQRRVFERAPRLRHLHITNIANVVVEGLHLPWAQITTLKTRCSDLFVIDALASSCKQLVSWSHTSTVRTFTQTRQSAARITLPHLRHLVVESINVRDTRHAWHFEQITAPRLETLSVNWPYSPDVNGGSIAAFVTRSGCKLRSLSIKRPSVREWVFIASSHRIPHYLFIDRVSLSAIDAPNDDVVDAALSRPAAFAPLLKMNLWCFGTLEGQFLIELACVREDGCRAGRLEVIMCAERSALRVSEGEREQLKRLLPYGVSIRKLQRMLYEADEDDVDAATACTIDE